MSTLPIDAPLHTVGPCPGCRWRRAAEFAPDGRATCDAFPHGVPLRLLAGLDGDHRRRRGDEADGVVFEPALATTSRTPVRYWLDLQNGQVAGAVWVAVDGRALGYAGRGEHAVWRRRGLHDAYRRWGSALRIFKIWRRLAARPGAYAFGDGASSVRLAPTSDALASLLAEAAAVT